MDMGKWKTTWGENGRPKIEIEMENADANIHCSAPTGSDLLAEMLDLAGYCDERARLLDRDIEQHGYGSTDTRRRWKVKAGTLRATASEIRQRCRAFIQNIEDVDASRPKS